MSFQVDSMNPTQVGCMYGWQEGLCKAQTIPLFGPLVISPIKAGVSLTQFVLGLIASIISGLGFLLTCCHQKSHDEATDLLSKSLSHTLCGARGLASSIANMVTLGIFGCCAEGKCKAPSSTSGFEEL